MIATLRLSIGLFTALPIASEGDLQPSRQQVRWAVLLAPLSGVLVGLTAAAVLLGMRLLLLRGESEPAAATALADLLSAAVALALVQLSVGGLHFDGLADTVDGMAARGGREAALSVMRRSDIGPMGVTALIFTGLVQVTALATSVVNGHGTTAIITACLAGRLAAVWACRLPAARSDGLGAWVAGSVSTLQAVSVTVLALGVPAALVAFDDDPAALPQTLAAVVLALVAAGLLQRRWRRRMGGITGDTIGAGVEVATTVALVVLATIR